MADSANSHPHDILPQVSKASSQGFLEFICKQAIENTRQLSKTKTQGVNNNFPIIIKLHSKNQEGLCARLIA